MYWTSSPHLDDAYETATSFLAEVLIGAISVPQFRRGLNFAFGGGYIRESLTADELSLLESVYAREMLDGAHFVDWKEFVKDINSAIYTPGLEKVPVVVPLAGCCWKASLAARAFASSACTDCTRAAVFGSPVGPARRASGRKLMLRAPRL